MPGALGIEPPTSNTAIEHVIELAKAVLGFVGFPDFMHHEALAIALQQKLLLQEWDLSVPKEQELVLAAVESILQVSSKIELPNFLSEAVAWIATDNVAISAPLWERLVKMGVIDKQKLFLMHLVSWKSSVGKPTGATYRVPSADFFRTWTDNARDFLIKQEAIAEMFTKRNNGRKSTMIGPAMRNPPMPIDVINYFIFTEEERLKISNKQRRVQTVVEPRVPAVQPSSILASNVMRIGYIRSTNRLLEDRDVSVSPQSFLPPITASRRPFTFLELPAKIQQMIPPFGIDVPQEANNSIILTGLRSHNKMFSLSQSWPD